MPVLILGPRGEDAAAGGDLTGNRPTATRRGVARRVRRVRAWERGAWAQEPLVSPREPIAPPREPGVSARERSASPREPVVSPREPVVSPREPNASPREPIASPW